MIQRDSNMYYTIFSPLVKSILKKTAKKSGRRILRPDGTSFVLFGRKCLLIVLLQHLQKQSLIFPGSLGQSGGF